MHWHHSLALALDENISYIFGLSALLLKQINISQQIHWIFKFFLVWAVRIRRFAVFDFNWIHCISSKEAATVQRIRKQSICCKARIQLCVGLKKVSFRSHLIISNQFLWQSIRAGVKAILFVHLSEIVSFGSGEQSSLLFEFLNYGLNCWHINLHFLRYLENNKNKRKVTSFIRCFL